MRSTSFLTTYIESRGHVLPEDYSNFVFGGVCESECVFCAEKHQNHSVFKYDIGSNRKSDYGVYACGNCYEQIEEMETLYAWEQPTRSKSSEYDMANENRKVRELKKFKFDNSTYKYYRHLRPDRDRYVRNNECNSCYICNESIETMAQTACVPVSSFHMLSGGRIHICRKCEKYEIDFDEMYRIKVEAGEMHKCKCPNCKTAYYVDNEEQELRDKAKSISHLDLEWVCPECAYKAMDKVEVKSWLHNPENDVPRKEPMNRFSSGTCLSCKKHFYIDQMIFQNYLFMTHFVREDELVCTECSAAGVKTFLIRRNVFKYKRNMRIMIDEHEDEPLVWTFQCFRFSKVSGTMPEHILTSHVPAHNSLEAMFVIYDELDKLFDGTQTELTW